jgi:hypothetical protein
MANQIFEEYGMYKTAYKIKTERTKPRPKSPEQIAKLAHSKLLRELNKKYKPEIEEFLKAVYPEEFV